MQESERKQIVIRISRVSIFVNILLSVGKLFAGIVAHSGAMISDAVHSLSDVLSTFVVIIGIHIAEKDPDDNHPYGHERLECVAAIVLSVMLALTGLGIGYSGVKLIGENGNQMQAPGLLALLAAAFSILLKEIMFRYTRRGAEQIRSDALMADAWHHRSDALSSVGALIGIAGARMGYPIMDPIASIVICVFIWKAAYEIFMEAVKKMVDESVEEGIVADLKKSIMEEEGVLGIDVIRTRVFGSRYFVDVEIAADGQQTLTEAHHIAERVHDNLERKFPDIKHIMVHVNPAEEKAE